MPPSILAQQGEYYGENNPLVGFAAFREAYHGSGDRALKERALTTYGLDRLRADVVAGRLPRHGFVRQEQASLPDFLANRFGAAYQQSRQVESIG